MCNISINTVKIGIEILSALLTPTIAICTAWFIYQQKNIQYKQQQVELLKLRIEHIKSIFDTWGKFHQDIHYTKGYEARIIVPNGLSHEMVITDMEKVIADLFKCNLTTKYLFPQEIYNLEYKIITSLKSFIPTRGTPFSIYNLPLEDYSKNRDMFNDLYEKYEKTMDKESKICK